MRRGLPSIASAMDCSLCLFAIYRVILCQYNTCGCVCHNMSFYCCLYYNTTVATVIVIYIVYLCKVMNSLNICVVLFKGFTIRTYIKLCNFSFMNLNFEFKLRKTVCCKIFCHMASTVLIGPLLDHQYQLQIFISPTH